MIIKLLESKLFTVDPAVRFAREYSVSPKIWNEIWKRYCLKPLLDGVSFQENDSEEFLISSICGYFTNKTGRKANTRSMKRWIVRTEIYCRAQHIIKMGVRVVDSSYFADFEDDLLEELTRSIRFNGKKDSRTIV